MGPFNGDKIGAWDIKNSREMDFEIGIEISFCIMFLFCVLLLLLLFIGALRVLIAFRSLHFPHR